MDDESFFDLEPEADGPGLWDDLPEMAQSWDGDQAPAQPVLGDSDYEWNAHDFAALAANDVEPGLQSAAEVEPEAFLTEPVVASLTEQADTEQADTEQAFLDETVLDETVLDETVLDETVLDETVLDETVLDEQVAEQAFVEQTPTEQGQDWADFDDAEHQETPSTSPAPLAWTMAPFDTPALDTTPLEPAPFDTAALATSHDAATSDPAHLAADPTEEVNDMGTNSNWKDKWADPAAGPAAGVERVEPSDSVVPHPLDSYTEQGGRPLPSLAAESPVDDEREVLPAAITRRLLMAAIATAAIVALLFVGKSVFGSSSSTSSTPQPAVTAPAPTTVAPLSTEAPATTVGAPKPAPTPNVVDFS